MTELSRLTSALSFGRKQASDDGKARVVAALDRAVSVVPLSAIQSRSEDTRPARASHVLALAESIAAIGLITPPAVDGSLRLVAGLHRVTACQLLATAIADRPAFLEALDGSDKLDPTEVRLRLKALPAPGALSSMLKAGKVPVAVLDLNASKDPSGALAAEAAENTARRSYTKAEVADLVKRLKAAGYRESAGGRPRAGEKNLRPALALVLGVSGRHATRLVAQRKPGHVSTFPKKRKYPTQALQRAAKRLEGALEAYMKAAEAASEQKDWPILSPSAVERVRTALHLL